MLIKLFIGLVIFYAFVKLWRAWKATPENKRKPLTIKIVIGVVVASVILAAALGKVHPISALLAALVPLARFGFGAAMRFFPMWMQRSGGVASFKTEYLNIQFHIQQARIDGEVIKGPHEGKQLGELTDTELDELASFYEGKDSKSFYLIRAYKKQGRGQQGAFGQGQNQTPPSFGDPALEEALEILGLEGEPTKEEIISAHRKLINKLHPDRGGSAFLASRVNQARDVLIRQLK